MDSYDKLIEKKRKLDVKAEDMQLNIRLAYWKYKKMVNQYKSVMKERHAIIEKVTSVQKATQEQINQDMEHILNKK